MNARIFRCVTAAASLRTDFSREGAKTAKEGIAINQTLRAFASSREKVFGHPASLDARATLGRTIKP